MRLFPVPLLDVLHKDVIEVDALNGVLEVFDSVHQYVLARIVPRAGMDASNVLAVIPDQI